MLCKTRLLKYKLPKSLLIKIFWLKGPVESSYCPSGYRFSVSGGEKILELDGGEDYVTLQMYIMPLNCMAHIMCIWPLLQKGTLWFLDHRTADKPYAGWFSWEATALFHVLITRAPFPSQNSQRFVREVEWRRFPLTHQPLECKHHISSLLPDIPSAQQFSWDLVGIPQKFVGWMDLLVVHMLPSLEQEVAIIQTFIFNAFCLLVLCYGRRIQ